eukprot:6401134-Pyramimonas_sp.AAC.1
MPPKRHVSEPVAVSALESSAGAINADTSCKVWARTSLCPAVEEALENKCKKEVAQRKAFW